MRDELAAALNAFKKAQAKLLVTRTGMTEAEAARAVTRQCAGVLHPDIKLPFDDVEFANCTVADVLADPERFVGATLADPLEGVRYGRGKAKVMQRADGSLWIHSFAHGRTVYTLKLDAKAAHAILAKTAPDAAIATFIELTASADLDEVERLKLRELTAKISGEGVRAIDKIVKDGKQERNAKAKHERKQRARAEHKQRDTRVLLKVPAEKDELIRVMETIFDVLRNATGANHPTVDMEGCLTEGIKRRIPPGMHVLTASTANADKEPDEEGKA